MGSAAKEERCRRGQKYRERIEGQNTALRQELTTRNVF